MAIHEWHKSAEQDKNNIYGMIIDFTRREVQYVGQNKSYSPLIPSVDGNEMTQGDWANMSYLNSVRPAMCGFDGSIDYYLNEHDYTLKQNGEPSDVSNINYEGNAMTVIPKIFTRSYNIDDKRYVYFSQIPRDGFEPVGFNVRGTKHDYMLIPMFYGSVDAQGRMRSIAGVYSAGSASGNDTQNEHNISMDVHAQHRAILNTHVNALFFGGAIVRVLTDLAIMLTKSLDLRGTLGLGINKGHTADSDYSGHWGTKPNEIISQAFSSNTTGTAYSTLFHSTVMTSGMLWQRDPYVICDHGRLKVSPDYTFDVTADTYIDTGLNFSKSTYYKNIIFIDGFGGFVDPESASDNNDGYFVYANTEVLSVASGFGCIRNGDKASALMLSMNHSAVNAENINEEGVNISLSDELDESFSWWWNFGASIMIPSLKNNRVKEV